MAEADRMKPLFIPLKKKFWEQFRDGTKDTEYRRRGPRWNLDTCQLGRQVVLSCGYSGARLTGTIIGASYHTIPESIPGWVECYGRGAGDAVCIKISLHR